MLIDVHCHLDFKDFDADLDKVIEKCKSSGIDAIICNGVNQKSNEKVLKIAETYKIVHAALGLYPSDALQLTDEEIDKVLAFIRANKSKIIAIGEVGIDFFHVKDEKERARECEIFVKVVKLANSINKPLIVHSRNAAGRLLELLRLAKVPVDLHFYCGNAEQTKTAVSRGYYFSIPTAILRSKTMKKLAKRVPIDRILTETDAPYLHPEGCRNDPSYVRQVVDKIAEVKGLSAKEVEEQVWKNFETLFAL